MLTEHHATPISNAQHLRHDLMIELGRLEMALEDAGSNPNQQAALEALQTKHARVSAALDDLPES